MSCVACQEGLTTVNLSSEEERLRTFGSLEADVETKNILAAYGFYYTLEERYVRCRFCGVEIELPSESITEDVLKKLLTTIHPSCDLIMKQDCGNVPFSVQSSKLYLPANALALSQ